jgi:hypothetical protein
MLILLGVIRCGLTGCPQEKTAFDHLDRYPWWPDHLDLDRYEGVQEEARRFPFQTGYAPGSKASGSKPDACAVKRVPGELHLHPLSHPFGSFLKSSLKGDM